MTTPHGREWSLRSLKPDLSIRNSYDRLFLFLLAIDIFLRVLWLDKPTGTLIWDEFDYVNAARVILGLPLPPVAPLNYAGAPVGLDPNRGHPPFAKLLIALSMYIFGDNGYGWRIPSVVLGTITVLVFFLLLKKVTNSKVALLATFLLSFENLTFIHSRIGSLEIFVLGFMMLGFYAYFSGRYSLSAIFMALSTLSKITGIFGIITIVIFHFLRERPKLSEQNLRGRVLSWTGRYIAIYLISFLVLLTVMDHFWSRFSNPFDHLQFVLGISLGKTNIQNFTLISTCPQEYISCPWQWLINQVPIPYLGPDRSGTESIVFTGAMNPAILYLTIPAMLYAAYEYYERRENITLFAILLFCVTYFPFYPLVFFTHRITFLYYFLLTMPAVCAALAYAMVDLKTPRLVVFFYLAIVLISFFIIFPFKAIPS